MRRLLITLLLVVLPLGLACAEITQVAAQADAMHDTGMFVEARKLLLDSAAGAADGKEQAELYWRAARETLELGDIAEKEKKPPADVLAVFLEGEGYADKAIAADPRNDLGYYWKSSNIGRWGQVKGILNSLFKAGPMKDLLVKVLSINPDRTDAYYVLGQLYRELPGWPVSFGSIDAAVSLGRKAVDLRQGQVQAGTEKELAYNFFTELAKTLYKRNLSSAARSAEQKNRAAKLAAASAPLDKGSYFEATVSLKDMSDREEAKALAVWVVTEVGNLPSLSAGQAKDLQKAKDVLKGW
jgi:tetratricopeptide (TPR) repeat protein